MTLVPVLPRTPSMASIPSRGYDGDGVEHVDAAAANRATRTILSQLSSIDRHAKSPVLPITLDKSQCTRPSEVSRRHDLAFKRDMLTMFSM